MLDLEDLKAKLAEYDPAAPKCPLRITRHRLVPDPYGDYDETTYVPRCRPKGHEDECRNARQVIGWPGFETVSALVAEVERLREVNDGYLLEMGRQCFLLRDQKRGENAERASVVAWLREYAAPSPSDADNLGVLAPGAATVGRLADAIERGEHRKEKE
jgi:hypothetical protein